MNGYQLALRIMNNVKEKPKAAGLFFFKRDGKQFYEYWLEIEHVKDGPKVLTLMGFTDVDKCSDDFWKEMKTVIDILWVKKDKNYLSILKDEQREYGVH